MKPILTIIFILLGLNIFSQDIRLDRDKLPAYVMQGNDTLGIVFTIKDVQKIDKNLGMLKILQLTISGEGEFYYANLLDKMDEMIRVSDEKIMNLAIELAVKSGTIKDLKLINSKLETKITSLEEIIKNNDKQIRKLKRAQKFKSALWLGFGIGITYLIMVPKG